MVFSTPQSQFCVSDRDTWGEGTSDKYLQSPKSYSVMSPTCGQHVLTKVDEIAKNDFSLNVSFCLENPISG